MTLLSVERSKRATACCRRCAASASRSSKGETVALVGANGAGKTTLLRTIAGAHPLAGGRDRLQGRGHHVAKRRTRAPRLGIALVPEGRRLFARPDGRRKPAARALGRPRGRVDARRGDGGLSQPQGAPPQPRRHSVGRRAAGDRDRPRADDQPGAPAARRGVARPVAARRRSRLRAARGAESVRRRDLLVEQDLKRAMATASRTICMLEGRDRHRGADRRADPRAGRRRPISACERAAAQGGAGVIFVNQILQGVLLGGYYALIACGLSFMFSVMRIINLAHGSLAVLAAYALFVLADRFGVSPFLGLVVVAAGDGADRRGRCSALVLERSARGGLLVPVLSTFGLSIVIDNLLFQSFGADTRSLAPYIGDLSYDSWSLTDDIAIGKLAALTMAIAIVLLGGIQLFLNRTQIGRAIRATAEDPDTVGLVGVNARRVNAIAAAIAMATVAIAGAFLGMRATFDPYAGAAAAHLRLRGRRSSAARARCGARWSAASCSASPRASARSISPQGFFIAGHLDFPRRPVRAALLRRSRPARSGRARRGGPAMSATPAVVVERWTPESRIALAVAGARRVALALGPAVFSANAVDKLTTLFIYVILARDVERAGRLSAAWCRSASRPSSASAPMPRSGSPISGSASIPSLFLGALIVGALSLPLSVVDAAAQGRRIRDRHVGRLRTRASARQSRHAGSRRDRHVADRAQRLCRSTRAARSPIGARSLAMAGLLAIVFCLLRSPLGAAIQAIRDNEEAAESIGVRVDARQAAGLRARRLRRGARRRAMGRDGAHLPAEDLFQPAMDRLHDLHGAGRRPRDVRGRDPRRGRLLRHRGLVRRHRRLVSRRPRRDGARLRARSCRAASGAGSRITTSLRLLPIGYRLRF